MDRAKLSASSVPLVTFARAAALRAALFFRAAWRRFLRACLRAALFLRAAWRRFLRACLRAFRFCLRALRTFARLALCLRFLLPLGLLIFFLSFWDAARTDT